MADIDIDFRTDFDPLKLFETAIRASRVQNGELKKHNAGVYFQNIAKDKITNLAAIPYEQAQELGYFKIDFLHLSLLDNFDTKHEIKALLNKEPNWKLLLDQTVVSKLFQLHRHYDLVTQIKPTSVVELADCIALIRPSKKMLVNPYMKAKASNKLESFRTILYAKPSDGGNYFKRPHAIAYALTIVLQLHLITAEII